MSRNQDDLGFPVPGTRTKDPYLSGDSTVTDTDHGPPQSDRSHRTGHPRRPRDAPEWTLRDRTPYARELGVPPPWTGRSLPGLDGPSDDNRSMSRSTISRTVSGHGVPLTDIGPVPTQRPDTTLPDLVHLTFQDCPRRRRGMSTTPRKPSKTQ